VRNGIGGGSSGSLGPPPRGRNAFTTRRSTSGSAWGFVGQHIRGGDRSADKRDSTSAGERQE
jgi:hypothetical protein